MPSTMVHGHNRTSSVSAAGLNMSDIKQQDRSGTEVDKSPTAKSIQTPKLFCLDSSFEPKGSLTMPSDDDLAPTEGFLVEPFVFHRLLNLYKKPLLLQTVKPTTTWFGEINHPAIQKPNEPPWPTRSRLGERLQRCAAQLRGGRDLVAPP